MPRRKLDERNIRKLMKIAGGSYMLTVPIEYIRQLGWQEAQKVVVDLDKKNKRIVIKDWEK